MYNVTSTEFNLWQHTLPHTISITFENSDTEVTITGADIAQNGLTIDRYSVSGNRIEIGSMIAGEMSLTLDNRDGRWNSTTFEGAQMYVQLSVTDGTNTSTIPMGYFTVDGAPRRLKQINLSALDRMMQFDKTVDNFDGLVLPATPPEWMGWCCSKCNVPYYENFDYSGFPCYNQEVDTAPTGDLTYRQILSWAAEMMGVCGWIDYAGKYTCGWYTDTGIEITSANRRNSDISEAPVVLTGVTITDADNVDHLYGSSGYELHIEGNELLNSIGSDGVGDTLAQARQGFTYYPFVADVLPMPFLWPMDMLTYDGKAVIVTNITISPNAFTSVQGQGESAAASGYAKRNPLTRRESAIIRALDKKATDQLTTRVQELLAINDLASNSLGFFTTTEVLEDGSMIVYTHNKPQMSDSTLVFKKSGEGFFVSTDGGQTWTNGYTADGTAVVNILSAVGINAEWLNIDAVIERINSSGTASIDSARVNIGAESLTSVYQALYETQEDMANSLEAVNTTLTSLIEQTAQSILLQVGIVSDDLENYMTQQGTFLRVTAEGVQIDETAATPTNLLLTGSAMTFQEDASPYTERASYRENGLTTPEAEVEGNLITGNYKWLNRTDSMNLIYIGE